LTLNSSANRPVERLYQSKKNPLELFQKYQKIWNKHKAPGEKRHDDLRWSVREQMLEKHVVVKVGKFYRDIFFSIFQNFFF
jgi:hypothetical protein